MAKERGHNAQRSDYDGKMQVEGGKVKVKESGVEGSEGKYGPSTGLAAVAQTALDGNLPEEPFTSKRFSKLLWAPAEKKK